MFKKRSTTYITALRLTHSSKNTVVIISSRNWSNANPIFTNFITELARGGFLIIFVTENSIDNISGFVEIEDNLILTNELGYSCEDFRPSVITIDSGDYKAELMAYISDIDFTTTQLGIYLSETQKELGFVRDISLKATLPFEIKVDCSSTHFPFSLALDNCQDFAKTVHEFVDAFYSVTPLNCELFKKSELNCELNIDSALKTKTFRIPAEEVFEKNSLLTLVCFPLHNEENLSHDKKIKVELMYANKKYTFYFPINTKSSLSISIGRENKNKNIFKFNSEADILLGGLCTTVSPFAIENTTVFLGL